MCSSGCTRRVFPSQVRSPERQRLYRRHPRSWRGRHERHLSRHLPRRLPAGTKVIATDSAKQAHYLPAITGVQGWFGSVSDCVDAALTGDVGTVRKPDGYRRPKQNPIRSSSRAARWWRAVPRARRSSPTETISGWGGINEPPPHWHGHRAPARNARRLLRRQNPCFPRRQRLVRLVGLFPYDAAPTR